ncbi:TadE/TadG family type IV pilus assembly protein [Promicromonospora thailandica]|uniref:TadE-like protein n=1 Tax=Promicromonospora thailandica TaxID=765201 RepID=A0A9X2JU05_9MICO|nr:TadE/TadG family type IV pilus assembly protein [Promicromonospora thailandica]MCP2262952.1 TadE-like protein [Promicromonospora thailandica]BFF18311.1 pilus assembly protein [Promicromonospora thailandica]
MSRSRRAPGASQDGSAAVEFLLVSVLVLALFLGVVQVALAVHVRSLATDAAAEGARVAARADRGPADGAVRTRALLTEALTGAYARDVTAGRTVLDGVAVAQVTVRAPLPVVGLLGPAGALTVRGHALEEQ